MKKLQILTRWFLNTKMVLNLSLILFGLLAPEFYSHAQVSLLVDTATLRNLPRVTAITNRPLFEDITIHRIQFRITTATQDGAGTDEGVYIQMNEHDAKFYLARSIDNFESGHTDTYDFISMNINRVKDIQFLRIGIAGDDAWRMRKIELFINDNDYPVFSKDYGRNGKEVSHATSTTIPYSALRADAGWKYSMNNLNDIWQAPQYLPIGTLTSMVEAAIGSQLSQNQQFGWGTTSGIPTRWGPAVEAKYINARTVHFDLDLQRYLFGPNPEVDVDFDLEFRCDNNTLKFDIKNVAFGTNYVGAAQSWLRNQGSIILGGAIGSSVGHPELGGAAGGLLAKFLDYGINFQPAGIAVNGSCNNVTVLPNGDIKLY